VDSDDVLTLMKTVAAEVITPRFRALADGDPDPRAQRRLSRRLHPR
jgi:hypothetical protein